MTETKFTPGPWRLATKSNFSNLVEAYRGGETSKLDRGFRAVASYQSCTASRLWEDEEENRLANGHLIAAAPEMFEALDEVAAAFSEGVEWTAEQRRAYELVRGALSKALGKGGV